MTPARWLITYLLAVVAVSVVHRPVLLAGALVLALAASGAMRWQLLRRTLWTVALFGLSLSAGLLLVAAWTGAAWAHEALLLLNLRLLLLGYLGHWVVARVDLLQALVRWPSLLWVATLAVGQARVFARSLRDFRLAFRSRNPRPPRRIDQGRHAAAQAMHLLDKAHASAAETALAMRSRGCFDD